MKVVVEWLDENGNAIVDKEINNIDMSDIVELRPIIPKMIQVCDGRNVDFDISPSVKAIRIKVLSTDEVKATASLSMIKAFVDQEFFKLRTLAYDTPWWHPIKKIGYQRSYHFIHVVRELIKKAGGT
jgi:hypothetical protein